MTTAPTQHAPLVFSGSGWLALMRDGKPKAIKRATPFEGDANWHAFALVGSGQHWADRDYWKPVTDADAARYRLTLPVLD